MYIVHEYSASLTAGVKKYRQKDGKPKCCCFKWSERGKKKREDVTCSSLYIWVVLFPPQVKIMEHFLFWFLHFQLSCKKPQLIFQHWTKGDAQVLPEPRANEYMPHRVIATFWWQVIIGLQTSSVSCFPPNLQVNKLTQIEHFVRILLQKSGKLLLCALPK